MKNSQVTNDTPKVFLTDYASYNNGTQFEFGHWVDLTDFSDADSFLEYCTNHFAEADKKSPLGFGAIREEMMITDYENLPRGMYSESGMNWEQVYEYINLDDNDKARVAFIMEQGEKLEYALSKYEDVIMYEDEGNKTQYELFDTYYPEAEKLTENCPYLEINYDQFIRENFTEFEHDGTHYLVDSNWNC